MNAKPQREVDKREFWPSWQNVAAFLLIGSVVSLTARGLPVRISARFGSQALAVSSATGPAKYAHPIRIEVSMKIERKGGKKVVLDMNPERFSRTVVPGKNADFIVPVTNLLDANITVKSIAIEDHAGNLALRIPYSESLVLAPAEKLEIPVVISSCRGENRAHIHIVVSAPRSSRDEVKTVDVTYACKNTSAPP